MKLPELTVSTGTITSDAARLKAENLETACKDFEAILLNQMLQTMRKTVPEGGLFQASHQQKIYQSMFDERMTSEIVHGGGGVGLAARLYQELAEKADL